MAKKPNLAEALQEKKLDGSNVSVQLLGNEALSVSKKTFYIPPSRIGKKPISGSYEPAVKQQLKQIGLDNNNLTIQDMLTEALNDLFTKYGKPPIAS